ncbi:MAG: hypothetical protein IJH78_06700 [Clostridia bacterium]|nr:hypothetical protein [Clostridia bacterium]
MEKTWKQVHMTYLTHFYGKRAEEWSSIPERDDRVLFVNVYRMMLEAIATLPENPNIYVCVAMDKKMQEDRKILDRVLGSFQE